MAWYSIRVSEKKEGDGYVSILASEHGSESDYIAAFVAPVSEVAVESSTEVYLLNVLFV